MEGPSSLFRGLTPSLMGIVPAKSIYFFCYASTKTKLSSLAHTNNPHLIHTLSAMVAGSITGTVTNPIWYIKTRLQLKSSKTHRTVMHVIRSGYQQGGVKNFFRGLSASYVGVLETVIYFVLYEELKAQISEASKHSYQKFKTQKSFYP